MKDRLQAYWGVPILIIAGVLFAFDLTISAYLVLGLAIGERIIVGKALEQIIMLRSVMEQLFTTPRERD